ncbi:MAG: hypothetical protein ACRDGU_04520, partial [Actinomycetota bacterium]
RQEPSDWREAYAHEARQLVSIPVVAALRKTLQERGEEFVGVTRALEHLGEHAAPLLMVVSDERLIWVYDSPRSDAVVDLRFDDVVAAVEVPGTGEGDERVHLVVEADNPDYDDTADSTTLFDFELIGPIARQFATHIGQRIPQEALDRQPDVAGKGTHRGLGRRRAGTEGVALDSHMFPNVLRDMFERGEWQPSLSLAVPEPKEGAYPVLPDASVTSWSQCPICQGELKTVEDVGECLECRRLWCNPMRQPRLDESGKLIGGEDRLPMTDSELASGEWQQVTAYVRGPRRDEPSLPD